MKTFWKAGLGLLMAVAMATPSWAQSADVTGMWHPDKSSDWEASLCGDNNSQLCIRVVGLRDHMDTEKNRPYLNSMILDHAKPSGKNRWKGKLHLFGQSGDATITLVDANNLGVKVCIYVVLCKEYPMTR